MHLLTIKSCHKLSFATGVVISGIGLVGMLTPLVRLMYPGMYPVRNVMEGLGILSLVIALPLNVIFFGVITFVVVSIGGRLGCRKIEAL